MKTQISKKRILLIQLAIAFYLVGLPKLAQTQNLWHAQYNNNYNKTDAKGDFTQHAEGFIVTGHTQTASGNDVAYLLETDMNAAISWQTFIGDTLYNFYGTATKETSTDAYIVVGKTDKGQSYPGAYNDTTCLLTPYYNAFIAYIDPAQPSQNWYHIFGDTLLHDEAVEVIEDQYGNFVVTGVAFGKLSADPTCPMNNPIYTAPPGFDFTGIMLTKFDPAGNLLFNKVLHLDYYDQGVSVIDDISTNQYVVLANRRDANQTTFHRPLLLQTDYIGTLLNSREYERNTTIDKVPHELVRIRDDYFVVGQESNITRTPVTSSFLVVDAFLNSPNYDVIVHGYNDLLLRDVLLENDTLVLSGDSWLVTANQPNVQTMLKANVTATRRSNVLPLSGSLNISHYKSNGTESNTNFCIYEEKTDTQLTKIVCYDTLWCDTIGQDTICVDTTICDTIVYDTTLIDYGYHLFGNSPQLFDHVKTDHQTVSVCHLFDSIQLDSIIVTADTIVFDEDSLDLLVPFQLYDPDFILYSLCDSLQLGPEPYRETQSIDDPLKTNVRIYPNPSEEYFRIDWQGAHNGNIEVRLLDLKGQEVYRDLNYANQSDISIAHLKAGYYIVQIGDKSKGFKKSIIKL